MNKEKQRLNLLSRALTERMEGEPAVNAISRSVVNTKGKGVSSEDAVDSAKRTGSLKPLTRRWHASSLKAGSGRQVVMQMLDALHCAVRELSSMGFTGEGLTVSAARPPPR
jgi:hypothetical protein